MKLSDPYADDFTCTVAEKYSDFTHFAQYVLYDPVTVQNDCQALCVQNDQYTGISVHQGNQQQYNYLFFL